MTVAKFLSLATSILFCSLIFLPAHAVAEKYKRTVEKYEIPDVTLVNQDGKKIRLKSLVDSKETILLEFIFATCTTICPVLSVGFANFQKTISVEDAAGVRLVSITIDPEHDTPEVLRKHLAKYRAKSGWDFLTGTREDIDRVMKAFNAYVPNKMAHHPLTFLHAPQADRWVRIYGLIGGAELLDEYRKQLKE
jgi:protein SCO1